MDDKFKQLIRECNRFLYEHMYPGGRLEFASDQHRDLVRTFFAGAYEMLIALDEKETMKTVFDEYAKMTRENWRPDGRFLPPTL